jgi:OOP family OmpA-OmpF porin
VPAGLDEEGDAELQQGDHRGRIPLMLSATRPLRASLLAVAFLGCAWSMPRALAQTAAPAPTLIEQLTGSDTPVDIDVAALRQQAADRIQARADPVPARRPPIAPQLLKLPHFDFNAVFDPDTAVIRPQSYQTIGRLADALSDPRLLPYIFLIVNHTESGGNRTANLALTQRRADAIRIILINSFKISARRLQALGLGEEQLGDAARPTAPANVRTQFVTIGKVPPPPPQPAAAAPAKKGAAAKKRQ